MNTNAQQFVSEPIIPCEASVEAKAMARGEPGLPSSFTWREQTYAIVEVLGTWKESGPCRSGSSERYLRKHWYKIKTDGNQVMTLYFERQARSSSQRKKRWWLYTIDRL